MSPLDGPVHQLHHQLFARTLNLKIPFLWPPLPTLPFSPRRSPLLSEGAVQSFWWPHFSSLSQHECHPISSEASLLYHFPGLTCQSLGCSLPIRQVPAGNSHSQWPIHPRFLSTAQCGLPLLSGCHTLLPLSSTYRLFSKENHVSGVKSSPSSTPSSPSSISSLHLLHLRRWPKPWFSSCSRLYLHLDTESLSSQLLCHWSIRWALFFFFYSQASSNSCLEF